MGGALLPTTITGILWWVAGFRGLAGSLKVSLPRRVARWGSALGDCCRRKEVWQGPARHGEREAETPVVVGPRGSGLPRWAYRCCGVLDKEC